MVFLLKPNYRNVKYAKVNQTIFSQNHIFLKTFSRFGLERNYVQGGVSLVKIPSPARAKIQIGIP